MRSKRWPPLAALLVAGLMVFVVLPNPLRIPNNNPTASAEYAPVPGNEEADENANFAETAAASSAGIGSGGLGEGGVPSLPPPPQFRPRHKNCVGNPPRQTEDPLSPPCVPFFDGDNGGATYAGVTKNVIRVAFYNDLGVKGDMNKPWRPSDDTANPADQYGERTYLIRTIKAQLRYFQERYQTYGRTVHVIAFKSAGITTPCPQRVAHSYSVRQTIDPFAAVHLGDGAHCFMDAMAKEFKVPTFGLNSDVPRAVYEGNRPYIWGFFPDQEAEAAWSASFLCRVLRGGKARFTDDPALRGQPRKFGLLHPQVNAQRGPAMHELAQLLIEGVRKECGMTFDSVDPYTGGGQQQAADIMARYKQQGITTVVCYCVPVQSEVTVSTMQNTANSIGYRPEWYWDHASRMFRAIWNQRFGDPTQSSFGVNHHWRNPGFSRQYWYASYQQMEPKTSPNTRFNFDIYHLFLNLFQGIQGAGPRLTPETVERGMFTFNYLNRNNPFEPMGGYGPYGPEAVADYNFVDTAMGWWWDPDGTPPDGKPNEGCIRVMNGGKRYYAGEWPIGDQDLFTADAPCSQDDTKIADPTSF